MAYIPFMGKEMRLTFYCDGGPGWLRVKRNVLDELKIADKITWYSRQRGATVYLNAGCDIDTLTDALAKNGVNLIMAVKPYKSGIEHFERFSFYYGSRKV